MHYTVKFLKYSVIVLLVIILLIAFVSACAAAFISIFGILMESAVEYLLFIPIGFVCATVGVVILDVVNYLADKWELTK